MAVSSSEFLRHLRDSQLLENNQLAQAVEVAASLNSRQFGKWLVRKDWLTKWQVGQLLKGRSRFFLGKYKLLDLLGKGGMGSVYKAEQPELGRIVSLKVMSQELLKSPEAVKRFHREIRSVGALSHPNIVTAYDADCVHNTHFLVMEFVNGHSLRQWIDIHGQLPVAWSCHVAHQVAVGLQHTASRGMVHRDIKPSNILLEEAETSRPRVKILDLGLARFSQSTASSALTSTGQIMGTIDYIAPEQADNPKAADVRADIFSLGCTLFEMLAGQVPYTGETLVERLVSRMRMEAPALRSLRPEILPALETVVARCLCREPAERYQTPEDLASELAAFTSEPQPDAQPVAQISKLEARIDTARHEDDSLLEFFQSMEETAIREATAPDVSPLEVSPPAALAPATRPVYSRRSRKASNTSWQNGLMAAAALLALCAGIWFMRPDPNGATADADSNKGSKSRREAATITAADGSPLASESDLAAANWALSIGGSVMLSVEDDLQTYYTLPDEPFVLVGINVYSKRGVVDDDLAVLAPLSGIQELILRGTRVGDSGVVHLKSLTSLKRLNLAGTQISDDGLESLYQLQQLIELNVAQTQVSTAGIELLKERLPGVEVVTFE